MRGGAQILGVMRPFLHGSFLVKVSNDLLAKVGQVLPTDFKFVKLDVKDFHMAVGVCSSCTITESTHPIRSQKAGGAGDTPGGYPSGDLWGDPKGPLGGSLWGIPRGFPGGNFCDFLLWFFDCCLTSFWGTPTPGSVMVRDFVDSYSGVPLCTRSGC